VALGIPGPRPGAGRFITFEGPEGGGKGTQLTLLYEALTSRGVSAVTTREPGGTQIGRELRAMLLETGRPPLVPAAQALLLGADRAQHVGEIVRPALEAGHVVISDRFVDSTLAYQGFGEGLDLAALEAMCRLATGGLVPDLTILLDVEVEVGLARRRAAFAKGDGELNRLDRREIAFHERVRRGYLRLARQDPERFCVVDARLPISEVAGLIWVRVAELLDLQQRPELPLPGTESLE
jgi:dTMP kinase